MIDFFYSLAEQLNYFYVALLMAVESSFIPFPSEVVVPPAAYMAAEGEMNVVLVVVFATFGSLVGAVVNYVLSLFLGRPLVYRFADSWIGRLCLLNKKKIQDAESYFDRHGVVATLIGRLVPGIRQLISIPAGLARMNFLKFCLYTTLGAGVWNVVLAAIGYYLHSVVPKEMLLDTVKQYEKPIIYVILGAIVVAVVIFCFRKYHSKVRNNTPSSNR